MMRILNKKL